MGGGLKGPGWRSTSRTSGEKVTDLRGRAPRAEEGERMPAGAFSAAGAGSARSAFLAFLA
eukprot:CAMPEP_0119295618 /NCGR_PEP_ID=MMETSP1329-20130426/50092_1 /TAXON_ID=114041 /ORGANISM="Genus nov. species nov., Strain RCC1024" /LENGTH=59 /DNA_ID=CAMNT_0007296537 /DNA_START=74 /DNA_END=250 /DNA_ORIENTATION=-